MNKIIIHHSAVSYSLNADQFDAIDRHHKGKKFPKSEMGFCVGYHYVINADGKVTQARGDSEIGAHTRGHNDGIGICIEGNFSEELMTEPQKKSLEKLAKELERKYGECEFYGHRELDNRTCPGVNITEEYIKSLGHESEIAFNSRMWVAIQNVKEQGEGIQRELHERNEFLRNL